MTKPYIISVNMDSVHPFSGDPGWAQMLVKFKNVIAEEKFTEVAEKAGWRLLISGWDTDPYCTGEQLPMNLYFKPTRAPRAPQSGWADPHPWPYPQEWI